MLSIIGSKINPFDMPNSMMPNQARRKQTNTYDFDGDRVIIARKVLKPPWKIEEPI